MGYSTCQACQMTKKERKYSPPKIAESDPWVMVCVDLVGLFTIRTPAKTHSLLALTMIDPEINTGWFEIVKATNKSATSIRDLFHNTWLARYPQPQANVIIERVHKVVNDMLRLFDLENNHENLEQQEYHPFDYFLQSTAWSPFY
jgi:hypothetical protein